MNEVITQDGEIIEESGSIADVSATLGIARAEIDMQIATARAYPRRPKRIQDAIFEMATLDEEAAKESMYALPRGGKPITGPSVRFAEAVKQAFGNCRASSRVTEINRAEKFVEAEGVFLDLETNVATKITHRRRIVDKKGRLFNDDMILVTGNAACSIAMREAILKGVPKPIWRKGYEAVVSVVTGDVKTLAERRDRAIRAFAAFGVTPEQVFVAINAEGEADIKLDHLPVLFGMFSAIKNGESTVEEMFGKLEPTHKVVKNPLADEPAQETGEHPSGQAAGHQPAAASDSSSQAAAGEAESARSTGLCDTAAADQGKPEEGETTGDPASDPAFAAGVEAAMKGASRKAVPADIKGDQEKVALWHAGFDSVSGK